MRKFLFFLFTGGVSGFLFFCFFATPAHAQEVDYVNKTDADTGLKAPRLNIPIPSLTFRDVVFKVVKDKDGNPIPTKTKLIVPFLCDYIEGIFKFIIALAIILAVILIMHNGFKWAVSAGSPETITGAKKGITNALLGLLLLMGGVTLLNIINPDLTICKPFEIEKPFLPATTGVSVAQLGPLVVDGGAIAKGDIIQSEVFTALSEAMQEIEEDDTFGGKRKPLLTDGNRTPEKQLELFINNCVVSRLAINGLVEMNNECGDFSGTDSETLTCKPFAGDLPWPPPPELGISISNPSSEMRGILYTYYKERLILNGDLCQHTRGVAVDLYAPRDEGGFATQTTLKAKNQSSINAQKKLIEVMLDHGFCVLAKKGIRETSKELWHFELASKRQNNSCAQKGEPLDPDADPDED